MNITTTILSGAFLLITSTAVTAENSIKTTGWGAWENDPHALEPCINGGVSAAGLYPSQEIEFAALEIVTGKQEKEPSNPSSETITSAK